MRRSRSTTIALALIGLAAAAPAALADRGGQAPVKAPKTLTSHHAAFTLNGDGWGQVVTGGTTRLGSFGRYVDLPEGRCGLFVSVRATGTKIAPSVGRKTVRLRPGDPLIRVYSRGTRGAVTWWSGASNGYARAGGVQKMPPSLRTARTPLLVYQLNLDTQAEPTVDEACTAYAKDKGPGIVRRMAQTLKLASGAPTGEAPFLETT